MPTITLWINTGFVGCKYREEVEVPDSEWNALTEQQREDRLDELASEYLHNHIECGAYVGTEED